MKLQRITISGFRSIKEKETLRVDAGTTVLIVANDHRKTNILEAIQRINDDSPLTDDDAVLETMQRRMMRFEVIGSAAAKELGIPNEPEGD